MTSGGLAKIWLFAELAQAVRFSAMQDGIRRLPAAMDALGDADPAVGIPSEGKIRKPLNVPLDLPQTF